MNDDNEAQMNWSDYQSEQRTEGAMMGRADSKDAGIMVDRRRLVGCEWWTIKGL